MLTAVEQTPEGQAAGMILGNPAVEILLMKPLGKLPDRKLKGSDACTGSQILSICDRSITRR